MKLTPWREMANYEGTNYSDYLIAAQRFFRCSKLEQAAFAYIREHMHDLGDYEYMVAPFAPVLDVTFQDDCLVYRYMVLVHKDFAKGVRMAQMFADRLDVKGYVDPDSAAVENDDEFEEYEKLPSPMVFGAADPTGRYVAIKGFGGVLTTYTTEERSWAKERERAKREELARDMELQYGTISLTARSIDGIRRRWNAVGAFQNDDHQTDPLES
jgi:hypothetical protein